MQALVAKGVIRAFDLGNLVSDLDDIETGPDQLGHLPYLIFVEANNPEPDQIGQVIAYGVRLIGLFQCVAVFAGEFAQALVQIFHPPFNLHARNAIASPQQLSNVFLKPIANVADTGNLARVERCEKLFFLFKMQGRHGEYGMKES